MKTLAVLFIFWLPLSVMAILSVPAALVSVLFDVMPYGKDVLRAMDKLAAALLGWGGGHTVSAECGARQQGCLLCRLVCALLDRIQPGHCAGAARHEGLK